MWKDIDFTITKLVYRFEGGLSYSEMQELPVTKVWELVSHYNRIEKEK